MKIKKRLVSLVLSVTLAASLLSGCGIANRPEYVARLGHAQVPSSPIHEGAVYFADLVAKKTNGRVAIEIYPSGQIGAERDMVEMVGMGAVTMGMSIASVCAQFQPGVDAVCLPFLFESKESVYRVLDGEVGKKIFSAMEKSDVTVLSCFENGFRQLGCNREVNSIDDLAGLKLRAPEGDIYTKTWGALGVNVTATPWNETFAALQTGVVDGEEAPLAVFSSSGLGEVAKYFAYINYMYDPMVFYVNSDWYQSLPEDLRQAVSEAVTEATDYQRQMVAEQEAAAQKELEEEWGVTFTNPDLAPFREACASVYDSYAYQDNLKLIQDALNQ